MIAIDFTSALHQGAGIGRLVREQIQALAKIDTTTPYRLFASGTSEPPVLDLPSNFTWACTRISSTNLMRLWYRLRLPVPVELLVGRIDLYHATDFVLPPTRSSTKTIVTVHDLSFERVPESASPRLKAFLQRNVPRSVSRATHIIADSSATKADLIELYGVKPEKISVVLSGVQIQSSQFDLMTIRKIYPILQKPYLLAVGTVQPRKNYARIVAALARLRQKNYDLIFVIAGGKGWLEDSLYAEIEHHGLSEYVHFLGYVPDEHLPSLYSGAACVVYPSLYEGFGFPVLEGMGYGTPVITSNVSSLPEVAGDAAILVNPYDVDELADAVTRVIEDTELRAALIDRGYNQVKRFTWQASALQLKAVYDQILSL